MLWRTRAAAAAATLKALGYTFSVPAAGRGPLMPVRLRAMTERDAMQAVLMRRADALSGCTEGSQNGTSLTTLACSSALEALALQLLLPCGKIK
jgi:hypothetical protein